MRGGAEMGGTGGMNVSYLGETILMITDRRGGEKLSVSIVLFLG
jgi:hypothetical protein